MTKRKQNPDELKITKEEIPDGGGDEWVVCADCGESYVDGSPHAEFCKGKQQS